MPSLRRTAPMGEPARVRKRSKYEGPRWREFLNEAFTRLVACDGLTEMTARVGAGVSVIEQVAREIVRAGEGPAFLKSVRRGRPTARQNVRYQLLREVERCLGDSVPRRRPANNIADALALKPGAACPDGDQREFSI